MRRVALAILAVLTVLAAAGCGGDGQNRLTVSAASSLREALTVYGDEFDGSSVRTAFGGSDDLAAQIRQGVRPDVYAAANTDLPEALHREGLVDRPVVFASNELVVAVPPGSDIDSVDDLARPGVKVAIGSESVPVGKYARTVVGRLGGRGPAILRNVRAEEPDVKGVVGKVAQRAVDAGFVYATDVTAADGRVRAVALPEDLRPAVNYAVAVVRGTKDPEAARRYIDGLVRGDGARALSEAGFEPPR